MNFKQLDIKRSYISCGDENIAKSFLVPALRCAKSYKRSVGYFSSGVFEPIIDGIAALARNKGTIQLIASPKLSQDDINAISLGYAEREKRVKECFDRDFLEQISKLGDEKLKLLADLIACGILDIKIAITNTTGDYHDKLGILEDAYGNVMAFFGSPNSSINGYQNNYEKIRVVKGWISGESESVRDEQEEFQHLWEGTNPFVTVYEYKETARRNLLEVIDHRSRESTDHEPVILRDYQQQAIEAWVANGYHGFYVMATGTGKTWTAIYSAQELIKKHPAMIVICAPYKHLIKQWAEDVKKAFPESRIIMVSSENHGWEDQITNAVIQSRYDKDYQIIIISTIASFHMKRFMDVIKKSTAEKLLIVDEAHRFTDRSEELKTDFKYMLGLSATPFSGSSAQKGKELMKFFGGQVFSLTIEDALHKGYLVPYYYYPIFVTATDDEEQRFNGYTRTIMSCFVNNICTDPERLAKAIRGRNRVIAMAEEKRTRIDAIIDSIHEKDHFVVYCGDGCVTDPESGEELRHIQSVKRVLSDHGYKSSQFTAKENMYERMQLVDSFNKGEISALAAIRCLDEGINIPSIKSALILASNNDYREFVQRRGRILRTYKGKDHANIYDILVLPSSDMASWAKIEFRRYLEYARLALNWDELETELEDHLKCYGLSIEDVNVYDYDEEVVEEPLDE